MGRDVSRDKKIPVSSIPLYTVPKKIDFPRYNMKCSGENAILRGIFHVVSCFPLHFMLHISRKFELLFGQCRGSQSSSNLL